MDQLTEQLARKIDLKKGESELLAADPAYAVKPTDNQRILRANIGRLLSVKGVELRPQNKFTMKFEHPLNRKNALKGCPWVLDKHALILEPIDPTKKHMDHKFTSLRIVVMVHQLSLSNQSDHVVRLIGNNLGEFVEVPKEKDSFYSHFFRIKILLDVTTLLKRGIYFQGVEGDKQCLQVTCKRLPLFCFLCGIIGHREDKCPTRYETRFVEAEGELPYGSWMRVNMEKMSSSGFSGEGLCVIPNKLHSQIRIAPTKTGGEIFNFLALENKTQHLTENINPNTGKGREGMEKLP